MLPATQNLDPSSIHRPAQVQKKLAKLAKFDLSGWQGTVESLSRSQAPAWERSSSKLCFANGMLPATQNLDPSSIHRPAQIQKKLVKLAKFPVL